MAQMFMPAKWETKYETLKTEEKTWKDLDEEDSFVKIGDPVVQVLEGTDALEKSEPEPVDKTNLAPGIRRIARRRPPPRRRHAAAVAGRCDGSRKHDRADVPHAPGTVVVGFAVQPVELQPGHRAHVIARGVEEGFFFSLGALAQANVCLDLDIVPGVADGILALR